jgi:hypothetical protein
MKKLFENWNNYKNQDKQLEEGFENITPENIQLVLQALKQIGVNFAPAIVGLGAFEAARLIKQKLTAKNPEKAHPSDEALNESIGVDTETDLRTAVEAAYQEGLKSYSPDQVDANTNVSVNRDANAEVRNQIMQLVASYLENTSEPEEQEKDKKDVYEKGYSDGKKGYDFSNSYHGKMRDIYLDGHRAGRVAL